VGLNHRPAVYETAALPLSYAGLKSQKIMEAENPLMPGSAEPRGTFIPFVVGKRQPSPPLAGQTDF
jgi:hypothetical protein